jgi:hypothetical protein
MDSSDIHKMAEAVEAGLRDGRSLESLRNAMAESGYTEENVREVIGNVDRKKTLRRAERKKPTRINWAIAATITIIALIVLSGFLLFNQPEPIVVRQNDSGIVGINDSPQGKTTCYIVNESVKDFMVEAGAKCDRWILIKEI